MRLLAGFDVGGTKLSLALADLEGKIVLRRREATDTAADRFAEYRDGLAYLGLSTQMSRLLRKGLEETGGSLAAIGIGSAGPLKEGCIYNSTNIKLARLPRGCQGKPLYIPMVGPLEEEFRIPVRLENDCTAAVLGEVYFGVGKDVMDKRSLHLVYITLSTGFGAGVWDGGHLLRGKDGNAAEVGHFVVKEGGLKCGCGNYGCAEAYCSGTGIANNARMRLVKENLRPREGYGAELLRLAEQKASVSRSEGSGHRWELLEHITAPLVFAAAQAGDRLAREVIEEACHYAGIALADIANAYDPQVITVGGPLPLEHLEMVDRMREEMLRHLNVLPPEVRLTPLRDAVVEHGALVLAREAAAG
ncbi:MAG: ROK family protein [Candidatus Acetothermia bacterium]|jgi:glucokinase|nr:ROK family protein [Candidatus Acetothermia bacterium]MDH7505891.1 ROK family protein [Candidatus Acetothermia bacterium]